MKQSLRIGLARRRASGRVLILAGCRLVPAPPRPWRLTWAG